MDDTTLTNSCILPYSAREIFAAYADRDTLARWWGPHGNTNTFEIFDFREGGKWVFTMHDGVHSYANEWMIRQIEAHHIRMDHTVAPHFSLDITLEELKDSETEMIWISTWESAEFLANMRDYLIEKNTENFERLEKELAQS